MSDDHLEALLAGHRVNSRGRDLIRSVRAGEPVRAVVGGAGNVTGRYPSRKMQKTIQYESRTVEFAFVILCETDDAVHEFFDQPCRLSLEYKSRSGRRVVTPYTPDFLVLANDFVGFVECKPVDRLPKLAENSPFRYVDDSEAGWRCPPGEGAAREYGLGFRVWTPAGMTSAFVDNARFLQAEWGGSSRMFSAPELECVVERVRQKPGVVLEELVHDIGDPDVVFWAIYHRHVHVDLAAQLLSHSDRVRVFADGSAAAAWSAALASVPDTQASAAEVLACAVLAQYPRKALSVALERYRILRSAIQAGSPARWLSSTHRRWLLRYRKAAREGGVGLAGLVPRVHLRGNYQPRFPPETYAVV